MKENITNNTDYISWQVPEYEKHERSKLWYILAGLCAVIFLLFALFTKNLLFAFIIIFASVIMIINDGKAPENIQVILSGEGVTLGKTFYDYDEFKNFSVLYKPSDNIKMLYLVFNNVVKHRISLPLLDSDPLQIRNYLLQYLSEDLERENPPLSEQLAKIFKL